MLQNYLIDKGEKKPGDYADTVRARMQVTGRESDEYVCGLCEEAVFEDEANLRKSGAECLRLAERVMSCIRCELELLQEIVNDESITEIMVNGPSNIFYERNGKISKADFELDSAEQLRRIIQRLTARVGREMNDLNPIVDARLADGSRINAVNDNIAIGGPVLTIRKFNQSKMTMSDLVERGDISSDAAEFLQRLVESAYNIFISGGTSSGKTTFLNILSDLIPRGERIIVIEDSAELQIRGHDDLVRMEARSANAQGKGVVSISDLVKTSLRMRPDRIIVGEVRGGETVDMIQAMSTGHDGSLSTGHSNSPSGMIKRLETMYLSASNFPLDAVRAQISEAIEIIVQLKRFSDGHRRVVNISEIEGLENGEIKISSIFEYNAQLGLQRTENPFRRIEKLKDKCR